MRSKDCPKRRWKPTACARPMRNVRILSWPSYSHGPRRGKYTSTTGKFTNHWKSTRWPLRHELEEMRAAAQQREKEYAEKTKEMDGLKTQKRLREQAAVKRMFKLCEKRQRVPKEEEWTECIKGVENQYPRMVQLKADGKLEALEYRVCVLVKLEMKVNDIVFLTESTNSKISMMRSRLHQRLFGETGGAKDFDQRMAEV